MAALSCEAFPSWAKANVCPVVLLSVTSASSAKNIPALVIETLVPSMMVSPLMVPSPPTAANAVSKPLMLRSVSVAPSTTLK